MIVHKKGFPVSRRTTIGNPFLLYRKYNVPLKYENCVSYRVKSPSGKDALWEREPGIWEYPKVCVNLQTDVR
jgi:hypothetical protein